MSASILLDGRPVRAVDYCRVREEHVIEEEVELRRRYGRGTKVGPADTADQGMDMGRLVAAGRRMPWWGRGKEDGMGAKRIEDGEIMAALSAAPQSTKQIAEAIGRSEVCVSKHLLAMVERGVVEQVEAGGHRAGVNGRAPSTWRLSDRPVAPATSNDLSVRSKNATIAQAVEAVRTLGRPDAEAVAAHLKIGVSSAYARCKAAVEAGRLVAHGGGTPGRMGRVKTTWSVPGADDDCGHADAEPTGPGVGRLREAVRRVKGMSGTPKSVEATEAPAGGLERLRHPQPLSLHGLRLIEANGAFQRAAERVAAWRVASDEATETDMALLDDLDRAYVAMLAARIEHRVEERTPF